MKTLHAIRSKIKQQLMQTSSSAQLDADLLLMHHLNLSRTQLFTQHDLPLSKTQLHTINQAVMQRSEGKPIAYLIGKQAFWNLTLKVNENTLIPRPETEHIIEHIEQHFDTENSLQLLELGTGSGAIALALTSLSPNWKVDATDISELALEIAQENASHYNKTTQVTFYLGDWFDALNTRTNYDIIISNPPYIALEDRQIATDVKQYEPHLALYPDHLKTSDSNGEPGMKDLAHIIHQAPKYLTTNGWLYLEHGANQGESVRQQFHACNYHAIQTLKDLAGLERITLGKQGKKSP